MREKRSDDENLKNCALWPKVERVLLLGTFVCTMIATIYSVWTARAALRQAEAGLRPWITIPSIITTLDDNHMLAQFEITNVGSVPAYVRVVSNFLVNGKPIEVQTPDRQPMIFPILPGQTVWQDGIKLNWKSYESVQAGGVPIDVRQNIHVEYGTRSNRMTYFTAQTTEFLQKNLPKVLKAKDLSGLWKITGGDFQ